MVRTLGFLWLSLAALSLVGFSTAESALAEACESIAVFPAEVRLDAPRNYAHVLVTGNYVDGHQADLTRQAIITPSEAGLVRMEQGVVVPVANGQGTLHIEVDGHSATVPFVVSDVEQPQPVSFYTETVAALTRQGCNSGGCHGSPSGKGGFRLSLEAYDNKLDELTVIREAAGRRTNPIDPEASLLLLKPLMSASHGGGLKLRKTDHAYEILRQWIAEGCQSDQDAAPRCERLEVQPPPGRILKLPHAEQQIVVIAHFTDGTSRDVTRLTKFSSSDESIAAVSPAGRVSGEKRGNVAIMARYLEHLVACDFTLVQDVDGFVWNDPPEHNYIDTHVHNKLKQLQFLPSEICTDATFIRRVYLDLTGSLPSVETANQFLADSDPQRRQKLIDRLLDSPEYAEFWALKWGDLLRLQKSEVTRTGVPKYHQWLIDAFETNMPFNEFAYALLTARGSTFANPAANYYRACDNMEEATETTAQLFLGSRIGCAKCHNHPFENWTQDNYYGLGAFFTRVKSKPGYREEELVVFADRQGEVRQPRTGQTMKPWLPEAGTIAEETVRDRREVFADWLIDPANSFFAPVAVNRLWAETIGIGIVDPVDDFRASNPPANPELLAALAKDFVEHGYDQKHILRTILNSATYQRSSHANEFNKQDTRYFSHATIRMLTAEQLLDAVCHVTDLAEQFAGLPPGTRATQLPSPDYKHPFLDVFGKPARKTACACERANESTLTQAIEMFNGPLIHSKLSSNENRVNRLLAAEKSNEEILRELYLAAFCRPPEQGEVEAALAHVTKKEDRAAGFADVCWALLNTNEFVTQH